MNVSIGINGISIIYMGTYWNSFRIACRGKSPQLLVVMPSRRLAFLILSKKRIQTLKGEQSIDLLEGGRKELEIKSLYIVRYVSRAPAPMDWKMVEML